jgi:CheY-like chemotaxis protein
MRPVCALTPKRISERNSMSSDMPAPKAGESTKGRFGPDGIDRRRRHRAKIALPVHIRGGMGSLDPFEDDGTTIDASRDGLLVATKRGGYWDGQLLEVTFASADKPMPLGEFQRARVVRTVLMPNRLSYALALEYQRSAGVNAENKIVSSYVPTIARVLVVEFDQLAAGLTRDLLEEEGYEVVLVSNGKDALDLLLTDIPDVLLAQVEGGEVNGLELCSIVKKSIRLQHIPVILLTRSAQAADYSACHKAGAVMCMAMPCQPGKLQQVVKLVAPPSSSRPSSSAKRDTTGLARPQKS